MRRKICPRDQSLRQVRDVRSELTAAVRTVSTTGFEPQAREVSNSLSNIL